MKGSASNLADTKPNLGNTVPEEWATNQEASIIPWHCGERKFALRWVMNPANQTTKESSKRPAKK